MISLYWERTDLELKVPAVSVLCVQFGGTGTTGRGPVQRCWQLCQGYWQDGGMQFQSEMRWIIFEILEIALFLFLF